MPCNKPYSVQSSNPKMSGSVKPKSYQMGGIVTPSKGPQGPRRSPQQTRAAQKRMEAMRGVEQGEMAGKMQRGYEKATGKKLK